MREKSRNRYYIFEVWCYDFNDWHGVAARRLKEAEEIAVVWPHGTTVLLDSMSSTLRISGIVQNEEVAIEKGKRIAEIMGVKDADIIVYPVMTVWVSDV